LTQTESQQVICYLNQGLLLIQAGFSLAVGLGAGHV